MQKPQKSRALRNHKHILPVKKKAAGLSSGSLFVFEGLFFGEDFRAVLVSVSASIQGSRSSADRASAF
jgi:hypothetical protein